MESTSEQLSAANREIRHLQEMITALRTELETLRLEKDHAVQQAITTAHKEDQQLRDTVNALRDELEKQRYDAREEVNQAKLAASDEINQLKATITALRRELEGLHQRNNLALHSSGETPDATQEPHRVR